MPTVAVEALTAYAVRIFAGTGAPLDEARIVAEHLVGANLRGHDSHGVIRITSYVERARSGAIVPGAHPHIVKESVSTALIDGGLNYGPVVATYAMDLAIAKARETGVGIASAFNSGHIGRVGAYGERAVAAGMIGIGSVNTPGTRIVTAFGGASRRLGTNPIMIALPTEDPAEPFVLDMATSVVAEGKLRVAVNAGKHVPEGWILDGDGTPTTEPRDFYGTGENERAGALLPVGGPRSGYKGFGLNMAVEALSGILSGSGSAVEGARGSNGVFLMAIDPDRFAGFEAFTGMFAALAAHVQAPPLMDGVDEVLLAGEPERRAMRERSAHGIALDEETWKQIAEAAASVGVSPIEGGITA